MLSGSGVLLLHVWCRSPPYKVTELRVEGPARHPAAALLPAACTHPLPHQPRSAP